LAGREYPEVPVVGVGAVILDANQVLLVRRGQEPMKGEWSIPGGGLELGETLEAAVCREVIEETGLAVEVEAMVEVLDKIVVDEGRVRYHFVLIDFLAKPVGGTLTPGSDVDDARWVDREEVNSHGIYGLAPATIAVIAKAFRIASGSIEAVVNAKDLRTRL
jgi:8-oxo-dGTP diphosphatase